MCENKQTIDKISSDVDQADLLTCRNLASRAGSEQQENMFNGTSWIIQTRLKQIKEKQNKIVQRSTSFSRSDKVSCTSLTRAELNLFWLLRKANRF